MAEQSLKDKTVKGVAWSGVDNIVQYMVTFVVGIILARLLTPDDYGLIGLTTIFIGVSTALINGGFASALIRKKDADDDDYNTAFFVNLCMSLLLYGVIFLIAPLIAGFFNREELVALIRVSSLGMVFGALALVQQARLTKRIDFKTQTKITFIASLVSGIVGISMALLGFGVWSLVAQSLSCRFLRTSFLWFYNKWIPNLYFSKKSFNNLFGFGWKMMISGVLDSIWKDLYQVVIGKFYSPATLGQYTRSTSFSQLLSSNLTSVIERVTYPVLSEIQDDRERLVAAYRRVIKTTMFITTVCMFSLGAVSEPLLYCLIGPKWHDAAVYLPFICISGSLYPLHSINLNMLKVQGRSDLYLGLEIIKKLIGLCPLFVGALIGIIPMLITSIITGIICYLMNSYFPGKIIGYSSWMQIKDVTPSYAVAFFTALSVWFFKYLPMSNWIILPIQIVVGVISFLIISNLFHLEEYEELKQIVKTVKIKKRKNE